MEFTASHRFPHPFAVVADRFLDPDAHVGRYELAGDRDVRVLQVERSADALDLKTDARQRLDDLVERGVGVEMVLEPGEGEFHRVSRSFRQIGDPAGILTRLQMREPL